MTAEEWSQKQELACFLGSTKGIGLVFIVVLPDRGSFTMSVLLFWLGKDCSAFLPNTHCSPCFLLPHLVNNFWSWVIDVWKLLDRTEDGEVQDGYRKVMSFSSWFCNQRLNEWEISRWSEELENTSLWFGINSHPR